MGTTGTTAVRENTASQYAMALPFWEYVVSHNQHP